MRPIAFACALSLLFAPLTTAGLVYDFETNFEAPRITEEIRGKVWVDGDAYRAEVARGTKTIVVISRDRDETATFLDVQKRTWSNRSRTKNAPISSALFHWPVNGAKVAGRARVEYRRQGTAEVAGHEAAIHEVEVAFNVTAESGGSAVPGKIHVVARIWTVEELPPLPMRSDLRTGYASVDREIEKRMENVRGFIARHELTVTRALFGGPPQTERTITKVTNVETSELPSLIFEVPEAFEYAGPATP
jgi:hypothetical protein